MSAQNSEIYLSFNTLSGKFLQSLFDRTGDRIMNIFAKANAGEGTDSAVAQFAAAFSPDPVSTAAYLARQPYTKPEFVKENLKDTESRGWVTFDGSTFTAKEKAIEFNDRLVWFLLYELNPFESEVSVDIPRLVKYLKSLVESADQIELPLKPSFPFSRKFEYEDPTPSLAWVRRHLITLGSFRDDCHLSSWQEHELPGYVWETLSYIWQADATTAEQLAEKLSGIRGYQKEDYAAAIDQLVSLGWVTAQDDQYQVTETGKQVRESSEELTNRYYKKAFTELSKQELEELNGMLDTLAAEIEPQAVEEG